MRNTIHGVGPSLRLGLLVLGLVGAGVITFVVAADPVKPDGSTPRATSRDQLVARWVADLGSDKPEVAQAAYVQLRCEGEFARQALVKAAGADGNAAPAARAAAAAKLLQELDAVNELPPVEAQFLVRGYCHAGSTIRDTNALGGFGRSHNLPRAMDPPADPAGDPGAQVYLRAAIDERAPTPDGKHLGFALYLVNASGKRAAFSASDSRLSLIREAKDPAGQWRPIEYLPSSWCGNSYHRVLIDPGQGWRFVAPVYAGPFKTTMRFVLLPDGGGTPTAAAPIYSNEFDGSIDPAQFKGKQGHRPTDIMDPYLD